MDNDMLNLNLRHLMDYGESCFIKWLNKYKIQNVEETILIWNRDVFFLQLDILEVLLIPTSCLAFMLFYAKIRWILTKAKAKY